MRRLCFLLILPASACDDGREVTDDGGLQLGPIQWGGHDDDPQGGGGGVPPKPGSEGGEAPEPGDPEAPGDAPEVVEPDSPEVVHDGDGGGSIAIVDAGAPPPGGGGGGGGGGGACGELTYEGLCEGRVAHWCDRQGRRRSEDCGDDGCGWVNPEVGYFCGGSGDGPGGGGGGDTPPDQPPAPPPDNGGECGTAVEAAVVVLANQARARSGGRELACDAAGTRAARAHSQDMCDNGYFSHTGRDGSSAGDRMRREGAQFGGWGENIAWGQRDANAVHTTWMNSSGHRRNILGSGFARIGVGLAVCGGRNYWTQVFLD